MYGPVTDPGEATFSKRVKEELKVDILSSPYRDYDINTIVTTILSLPRDTKLLLWGSSLGANNCPVVAHKIYPRKIDGMWGFQASIYGAQVVIPDNVAFAHEVYNSNYIETQGLGAYRWTKASKTTNLYLTDRHDIHPGETQAAQDMFLAEMKRVIS